MPEPQPAALYLALAAVPGVGPVSAQALLDAAVSPAALLASEPPVAGWESLPAAVAARLAAAFATTAATASRAPGAPAWHAPLVAAVKRALPAALAQLDRARRLGLSVLCRDDPDYPPALLEGVATPPTLLFVAGRLPDALARPALESTAVAIVGARGASRFSLSLAHDLATELSATGISVVSGLALGVDGAAHEGALAAAGAATVAVLGSGHARLHPRAHEGLAARIVASGGAVVSEWPPDSGPQQGHFPWRNRIISALARAVVVVEAAAKSGALSTVGHALAQGRSVLVVPDRPDSLRAAGNLALLRDGATPLIDASDVLALFPEVLARRHEESERGSDGAQPQRNGSANSVADRLLGALAGGAWHTPETLAGRLALPARVLLAALTELEVAGAVSREAGLYRLCRPLGGVGTARRPK